MRSLQTWIRSRLKANPFGVECCVDNGRQLGWHLSATPDVERKQGRIVTNVVFVPKDSIRGLVGFSVTATVSLVCHCVRIIYYNNTTLCLKNVTFQQ